MAVSINAVVVEGRASPIPQLLRDSGIIGVVGVARTLKELRRQLPKWDPDVICLDMTLIRSLPALITYITQYHRQTRCVIARRLENAATLAHYLRQGAIGYTQDDDFADCAVIVSQAAYRTAWIGADVAQFVKATLQQVANQRQVPSILSQNEQVILDHIVSGKTCQDIALTNAAWSEQSVLAQIYNMLIHYQQTL